MISFLKIFAQNLTTQQQARAECPVRSMRSGGPVK